MGPVQIAELILNNLPLLEDLYNAIKNGGDAKDLSAAIRGVKTAVSDQAMREELGLPPA